MGKTIWEILYKYEIYGMCMCVHVCACLQVQSSESESKIVSQYSELVNEAKHQFQREVSSLTPEIQANWKGLSETIHTFIFWVTLLLSVIECSPTFIILRNNRESRICDCCKLQS